MRTVFAMWLVMTLLLAATPVAQAQPPRDVVIDNADQDLGSIRSGTPVTLTYTVGHTARHPVVIRNVQASCGCSAASKPRQPILPGRTDTIAVVFNASTPGRLIKRLTVETSPAGSRIPISLRGTVVP